MDKEKISRRYAVAIYNIAKSTDKIDEVKEVIDILIENYRENKDFKFFFFNPSIKLRQKEEVVDKIFGSFGNEMCNIVKYIIKKGRLFLIKEIKEEVLKIYYRENNFLSVIGIFAKELSLEQREKLKEKLKRKYKREIQLKISVDEGLIGGGILKIGNEVIDGSIKSQIKTIKKVF